MDYFAAMTYDLWPLFRFFGPAILVWLVGAYFFSKNKALKKEMEKYRADRLLDSIYSPTGRFIEAFREMTDSRQNAIMALVYERERQVRVEGYSPSHDMAHDNEEFAAAASVYAMPPVLRDMMKQPVPSMWPWDAEMYKPKPEARHRDWERAGALLLAALEKEYTFKALPVPDLGKLKLEGLESEFYEKGKDSTLEVWVDNKGTPEHHAIVTKEGKTTQYLNGVPKENPHP